MSGKKGMSHYSLETKLQAVQLHQEGQGTYAQIAAQLGIRTASLVEHWCQRYQREGEATFHKPIGRPKKNQVADQSIERLRMENALLKKFHTELRKITHARRNIGSSNTTGRTTR